MRNNIPPIAYPFPEKHPLSEVTLSYWKKQLDRKISMLRLPIDCARPLEPVYRYDLCSLDLSEELSDSLRIYCQHQGVTLFMVILAVLKILLHRFTSQDDIIVGSTIASLNRKENDELTGFFANTLPLRTNLSGKPTFQELLGRIRNVTLDAYTHQDISFEELVGELRTGSKLDHIPFFQVMLNMVYLAHDQFEPAEGINGTIAGEDVASKFDLNLDIVSDDNVIKLELVYNKTILKRSRIQEILHQLKFLFEQVVEDPDKPVDNYCLRTPQSAAVLPNPEALLPKRDYPLVTAMLFEWTEQSPDHPAIAQGGKIWTYHQLADSTLYLAQTLRNRGIEKGDTVAVTGRRSFGIVAASAAVFLSGGVLLLIDQSLPAGRKMLMCREAKAKFLLQSGCRKENDDWFQEPNPLQTLTVEPDSGLVVEVEKMGKSAQRSLPELTSEDIAYVFFTSGTTGTPKGVMGSHRGLSHFLVWQRETFAVGPEDRCAQLTGFSFDMVLRDIFLPLVSGATLCLPDEVEILSAYSALPWLNDERITLVHIVPSVALSWLDSVPSRISLKSLRVVFFAGEPLRKAFLRKWDNTFPDVDRTVNLYGPTETTLAKCWYELPPDNILGVQPIGRPLPDSQALVLSKKGQLCGIGEIGEIVLRTPFRLLGYINAAPDNRSRFVKNPFRDDPNDCVYFTGDLGRYNPDGILEILGRLDDQIKIRGVRIEPEEVMTALERHDQVDSAFVLAKKDNRGENILVAFIVPTGQAETAVSKLRTKLQQQLPEYMIPSRFIILNSLPLNPNGKVDREALTELVSRQSGPQDISIGPRTPIEKILADIWCEVLGLSQVGIYDTFLELGGHSLLATRIISQVWEKFNVKMSLKTIFEHSTIAGLGQAILHAADDSKKLEIMAEVLLAISELSEEEVTAILAAEKKHN